MYLQGGAIWHPRCGPGPTEDGRVLNGTGEANGNCTDTEVSMREFDRNSTSGVSELQVSFFIKIAIMGIQNLYIVWFSRFSNGEFWTCKSVIIIN